MQSRSYGPLPSLKRAEIQAPVLEVGFFGVIVDL